MNELHEDMGWSDPWFDDEEVAVAVVEAMMLVPVGQCDEHGWQVVTGFGSGPGFTGAPISWWSFGCGCNDADTSADTLEAVR